MSEKAWTDGPWNTKGWVPTWAYVPIEAPSGLIASCFPMRNRGADRRDEAEANAQLISAAPCLYEALDELMQRSGVLSILEDEQAERYRAALRKARGE